jgi:hypothetical protein
VRQTEGGGREHRNCKTAVILISGRRARKQFKGSGSLYWGIFYIDSP